MVKFNNRACYFWLGISLLFTLYYGVCFYYFVFSQEYVVQDDARQHVVWLQRFIDPELFPNDLIADYFQNLAPLGFASLYLLVAKVGIEPILFAKILPPILAILTTVYIYLFTLKILPLPIAACLSSLLINQLIWLNDDLVSATPRGFIYPLFAAFLYYLSKNHLISCLILMLLQGLFYPHILLIEMMILSLRLLIFKGRFIIRLTTIKQPYIWWIAGLIVTAIALYPITQKPSELATTVTVEQMQQMPEFNLNGRSPFFGGGLLNYWFAGSSGFSLPLFPTIVWLGLLLPWLLKTKLPIIKSITNKITIIQQVTIASFFMFIMAHLLLPRLHLPSRYTYHTLRFVLAISSAIVLTVIIDLIRNQLKRKLKYKIPLNLSEKVKLTTITLFGIIMIVVPALPHIFLNGYQGWKVGEDKEIYQYLAQQPKDILVASLSKQANNIPAFSQRSILVGGEFAMAYHPAYHNQIKQRTVALLQAQYSSDLVVLKSFIQQYNIDYFLLDETAFSSEYFSRKKWLINSSWRDETQQTIKQLKSGITPALTRFIQPCTAISTEDLILVDAACINQANMNTVSLLVD
ncbi:MAG: hypothetical protein WBM44_29770 [Waterburya sp.]